MASIAHLAAGAACGAVYAHRTKSRPIPSMAAFAAVALAPDLDLFLLPLKPSGTPFEHRVLTHSFLFAGCVGALVAWVRAPRAGAAHLGLLTAVALASHGLLDAMTSVGHAPRVLWPFTWDRIALPWQPIPGMASFQQYFSLESVGVFFREALVCVPLVLFTLWMTVSPRIRRESEGGRGRAAGATG